MEMGKSINYSGNNTKAIYNSLSLFKDNIQILRERRPDLTFDYFRENVASIKGIDSDDYWQNLKILKAYNTSIIFNCFSLFEASFESLLIYNISLKGMNEFQSKITFRYLVELIKISNINSYEKEFKFMFEKPIKDFLGDEYFKCYKILKSFYVIRHQLIHGSATFCNMIHTNYSSSMELDQLDVDYQNLIKILNQEIEMKFSNNKMFIEHIISVNAVIDLLVDCTLKISNKFLSDISYEVKILNK